MIQWKIFNFRKICILHGRVFVMLYSWTSLLNCSLHSSLHIKSFCRRIYLKTLKPCATEKEALGFFFISRQRHGQALTNLIRVSNSVDDSFPEMKISIPKACVKVGQLSDTDSVFRI